MDLFMLSKKVTKKQFVSVYYVTHTHNCPFFMVPFGAEGQTGFFNVSKLGLDVYLDQIYSLYHLFNS